MVAGLLGWSWIFDLFIAFAAVSIFFPKNPVKGWVYVGVIALLFATVATFGSAEWVHVFSGSFGFLWS
jgi:hypothetical protein